MITIYSKDYCPYCSAAKDLIKNLWFEYQEIDITDDIEKFIEIRKLSGMMTVPQIFAWELTRENCLGGYSDMKKLHDEGKLIDRLKKTS